MDYLINIIREIFSQYSLYTGTGIVMVLFFVGLLYLALTDRDYENRTVLLFGSIAVILLIFCPVFYYLYTKYVDNGTYWRIWWLIPVGIGLAYVGTKLFYESRVTGILLAFLVLILGGRFVYTSDSSFVIASNSYQLPQYVIDVCDLLEEQGDESLNVAFPAEFLSVVRQYDAGINMPYGREQLDSAWGYKSGFFEAMCAETLDFNTLRQKSGTNNTGYIVVNSLKPYDNDPLQAGFQYVGVVGVYEIYRYVGL